MLWKEINMLTSYRSLQVRPTQCNKRFFFFIKAKRFLNFPSILMTYLSTSLHNFTNFSEKIEIISDKRFLNSN